MALKLAKWGLALGVSGAAIAAICTPNLIEARKNGNETGAIGSLKTIGTAQGLFREADKEGDGTLDYGSLADLGGLTPIVPNAVKRPVGEDVHSTFSIDVDTASYSSVRQFLRHHTLPPADAVRIEELVNYFDYDLAPPLGDAPVAATVEVAACPWQEGRRLVRIGLKAREIDRAQRPATNLVFLIDVSGSMQSQNKLPLVVDSLKLLASQLGERDRVAVVVYAGASGLALPSTPGSATQEIRAALDRLEAGGSTNGGAGIQLAYRVAVEQFIEGGVNRVILATDGDFNVGISSRDALKEFIAKKARSGVFLTALAFGNSHQDAILETLADRGNGQFAYVNDQAEARKVLVEELTGTLVTVAKDVKVQVAFDPERVRSYRLIGYENRVLANREFDDDTKDAGDMGAGHTVTALYQVETNGQAGRLLKLDLRYKDPQGQASRLLSWEGVDAGKSFEDASSDMRFASSVAAFGMLLRESPHAGDATLTLVSGIAQGALGADHHGRRAEFVTLVAAAQRLRSEDGHASAASEVRVASYQPAARGGGGLIDSALSSGTKNGYVFEVRPSKTHPEFAWMATARPVLPKTTGDRWFVTNHEGVTYYSTTGPIPFNDDCTIPKGLHPVGK